MVNPSISQSAPTLLADTRARASRWSGQLGQLFGWLLVIDFGLMSVALGLVVTEWPETPEFLASAAGVWLLLLAGCRGLAALAQTPSRSGRSRRPMARLTAPLSVPRPLTRGYSAPRAGSLPRGYSGSLAGARPAPRAWPLTEAYSASRAGSPGRANVNSAPRGGSRSISASASISASVQGTQAAAPSSAGRRVAIVEVASCVGTGFVLLQADWPTRPAAIPIALTFAAMSVLVCAALDVLVARFSAEAYPRQRLIRAAGWSASAVLLMILIRSSAPAALATAAVLIGLVETGLGGLLLNHAAEARRTRTTTDLLSLEDTEPRPDVDHAPLLNFLTGTGPDAAPDFWPRPVPSETA